MGNRVQSISRPSRSKVCKKGCKYSHRVSSRRRGFARLVRWKCRAGYGQVPFASGKGWPGNQPLGIYEANGVLHLNFGKSLDLNCPSDISIEGRDRWGSQVVMQAIAKLMPKHLRGIF